jgi:hypothetical protein
MRTITAKFQSRCAECGGPIAEGDEIIYDPEARKVWHSDLDCAPEDPDEKPSPEASDLADRLKFE